MNSLISIEPHQLSGMKYSVIGSGGFTRALIVGLIELNLTLPEVVISTSDDNLKEIEGIPVMPLKKTPQSCFNHVVLGSDVYQIKLMNDVESESYHLDDIATEFYDIADYVVSRLIGVERKLLPIKPLNKPYVVFISLSHSVCINKWLNNFVSFLEKKGVDIIICHPLSKVEDELFVGAEFVFTWTGITEIFSTMKQRLNVLEVSLTYAECGFFPQGDYFYFDKSGVNASSQLMDDPLTWVDEKQLNAVQVSKKSIFKDRESVDKGWVFVPLQIESDSNIQLFSKFTNGMQEYIDFICAEYPNENIVFKAHPKDVYSATYHCQSGRFSTEDTLDLIAGATFVRGINSSVLFEAALFGKEVIADGNCLLNHPCGNKNVVLAAIIARQFSIKENDFSIDKLKTFSYFDTSMME